MANNPNHIKNLRPFKKGPDERRNTTGENRQLPELKALLEEVVGDNGAREIIEALHKLAKKGNVRAAELLLDRMYGKTVLPLKHKIPVSLEDARIVLIEKLTKSKGS